MGQDTQEEVSLEKMLSIQRSVSSEQEMISTKTELDGLQFTSMLHDVFDQIDVDDSGYISFAEWQGYVKSLDFDLIIPNWAIARLFASIDWLEFERFFSGFTVPSRVGFKSVFMGALMKSMLEADISSSFRAHLAYKYRAVVDDMQRQSSRPLGSGWALLPRISQGDVESGPMMEKSWTEPAAFKKPQASWKVKGSIFV